MKNNYNNVLTDEQKKYIEYNDNKHTRLIACAGSGKTGCIILKMYNLIKNKKYTNKQILMLTFSRFTRDDFINKINKYKIRSINKDSIKTIDSFAKYIIDDNNVISDVSLLSYKFMKFLNETTKEILINNIKLNSIKVIFIDEAQDLNEIQYTIISLLKDKLNIKIHLIGDPNQNIYQFRHSSDKYLMNFTDNVETFYLTKNFRSYNSIIDFSKHLRVNKDIDITGKLGNNKHTPSIVHYQYDTDLEKYIIDMIKQYNKKGIDNSEIAILAPTRGKMDRDGKSHGLCFISNFLYKNNIKFKQFYEESKEFISSTVYKPVKGHINILTFMGSKGLEWKYVILVDVETCLINKSYFDENKHNADRYLLYVACSRSIEHLILFSRYRNSYDNGYKTILLNKWFNTIPKSCYNSLGFNKGDNITDVNIEYYNYKKEYTKKINKIIDRLTEEQLYKLSKLCGLENNENNENKENTRVNIENIFNDFSNDIEPNVFLNKYIEDLFFLYYNIKHNKPKKKYIDIENIINSTHIITDVSSKVNSWFYMNREYMTWDYYDEIVDTLDKTIVDVINKKFNRDIEFNSHTIIINSYYSNFILKNRDRIKKIYEKYMKFTIDKINNETDNDKIKKQLFEIIVFVYSLETEHYFHVMNKGKKFINLYKKCKSLFDNIKKYAFETKINIINTNVIIKKYINENMLISEFDFIEYNNKHDKHNKHNEKILWNITTAQNIMLKHILQLLMCNIIYKQIDYNNTNYEIKLNFLNLLKGDIIKINLKLNNIKDIIDIII